MREIDIERWVAAAPNGNEEFRRAVHTCMVAFTRMHEFAASMSMKGGILVGLAYDGERYTRDIDLSTAERYSRETHERFVADLDAALRIAVDALPYNLDCRVRKHAIETTHN